jgi:hypothetical protein
MHERRLLRMGACPILGKSGSSAASHHACIPPWLECIHDEALRITRSWLPPVQGDISAGKMIFGVEGVDPARRAGLIEMLDIDLYQRITTMSDGQKRRVQICMGLLKPYEVRRRRPPRSQPIVLRAAINALHTFGQAPRQPARRPTAQALESSCSHLTCKPWGCTFGGMGLHLRAKADP